MLPGNKLRVWDALQSLGASLIYYYEQDFFSIYYLIFLENMNFYQKLFLKYNISHFINILIFLLLNVTSLSSYYIRK